MLRPEVVVLHDAFGRPLGVTLTAYDLRARASSCTTARSSSTSPS
jgi:hypothetical protein